jgi:hypothetical protein
MIAAIYARKSTEHNGVADEQKSVARQVEHARQYAERKGWTVAEEHVRRTVNPPGEPTAAPRSSGWRRITWATQPAEKRSSARRVSVRRHESGTPAQPFFRNLVPGRVYSDDGK